MSAQLGEVERLSFSELNRMRGVPTREIARSIASNQSLKWVAVDEMISIPDSQLIYEAIYGHEHIEKLVFVWVTPMVVGFSLHRMRNLVQLSFDRTMAHPTPLQLHFHRNLQEVRFCKANGMGDTVAEAVARVLRFRSCLTVIDLRDCGLSNNGLASIGRSLQTHSRIKKVCVKERTLVVVDEAAAEFARGIETNTLVEELVFGVRRVHATGWERIIRALTANTTLGEVQLFLGRLCREAWFVVARLLAESSTQRKFYLSVSRNYVRPRIMDQALRTFCLKPMDTDDIRNVCDALATFDAVDNLVLQDVKITAEGLVSIRRMLASNTTLRGLCLHHVQVDEDSAVALFQSLEESQSLDSVDLSSSRIGALAAVGFVASSQMFKKLSLSNNNLGDAGFGALGRAPKHNVSLEELKVNERNNITEDGVRALLDGIRVHQGLKIVKIKPLPSTSQQDELAFYLERNKHAMSLLHANLPLAIWPHVLKRADDCRLVDDRLRAPDMLHYFVKEKCELFTTRVRRSSRKRKRKRNNA